MDSSETSETSKTCETETRRSAGRFGGRKAAVAVAVLVVAAVAGGLLTLGPDDVPPSAAPVIRADTVTGAGAPAAAGDLSALIDERQKALREHPDDDASWTVLGTAYLEQARRTADPSYYPKSEQALGRSLKLRSAAGGNYAAMVGMGALANARHDFAGARKWGERVRAAEPLRWTVYPVLIDAYTQLGAYDDATAAVQRLLDLRPGLPAFTRAAYELEMHGRTGEAKSALEQAVGVAGSPAETSFCLHRIGELAWERGDVRGALRSYEAALRADPDSHPALAARARARAALGDTEAALRDYREVTGRVPLPEYVLALGELYESLGRGAEAREQYEVLRAEVKLFAAAGVSDDLTLGLFEADHGDPKAAVRTLQDEWRRRKSVLVADALGWALHRAGRDAEALPYARKAAGIGWRGASFSYHRGEIERALGMRAAARAHLGEALKLNAHFSPLQAPAARKALDALDKGKGQDEA